MTSISLPGYNEPVAKRGGTGGGEARSRVSGLINAQQSNIILEVSATTTAYLAKSRRAGYRLVYKKEHSLYYDGTGPAHRPRVKHMRHQPSVFKSFLLTSLYEYLHRSEALLPVPMLNALKKHTRLLKAGGSAAKS